MYFLSYKFCSSLANVNSTTWNIWFRDTSCRKSPKLLQKQLADMADTMTKNLRSYKQKQAGLIPYVPDQAFCTQTSSCKPCPYIRLLSVLTWHKDVAFKWGEKTLFCLCRASSYFSHTSTVTVYTLRCPSRRFQKDNTKYLIPFAQIQLKSSTPYCLCIGQLVQEETQPCFYCVAHQLILHVKM